MAGRHRRDSHAWEWTLAWLVVLLGAGLVVGIVYSLVEVFA